jgi:hypothetical protein
MNRMPFQVVGLVLEWRGPELGALDHDRSPYMLKPLAITDSARRQSKRQPGDREAALRAGNCSSADSVSSGLIRCPSSPSDVVREHTRGPDPDLRRGQAGPGCVPASCR